MELTVAIVAGTVAILACIAAWRARKSVLRLALEMVQLRDRLAHAEAAAREVSAAAVPVPAARPGADEAAWAQRVAYLETRLRAALELPDSLPGGAGADVEEGTEAPPARVRRLLERQGFTQVVVLEVDADGRVLVEAERGGVWRKGRAVIDADGEVQLASISSVRAFP